MKHKGWSRIQPLPVSRLKSLDLYSVLKSRLEYVFQSLLLVFGGKTLSITLILQIRAFQITLGV